MFRHRTSGAPIMIAALLLIFMLLLTACGGSTTNQTQTRPTATPSPTPSPSPTLGGPGQDLLNRVAKNITTAKSLHGVLNTTINGTLLSGTLNYEIWNVSPDKNRTVVLQSTLSQIPTGSASVTNGKETWQYDPVQKVVYHGPVTTSTTGTPTANSGFNIGGGQSQLILGIVQSVFTNSNATQVSSSAQINGHDAYQLHVTPRTGQGSSGINNISYTGDIYVDKTSELPLQVNLTIQSFGQVELDLPTLELNQSIPDSTFTFVIPDGVKELPLQQLTATPGTGTITLAQAQQQAGYHLLSIPGSQTDYQLNGVTALGSPGSQIFSLNYNKGNSVFTITQGKALANLTTSGGQQISLRGTTATFTTASGVATLAWTEKGVGIQISGNLSQDQVVSIANLLS